MILDPVSRDLVIRTLYGEAASDPASQAAVAHVIRNRMNKSGAGAEDVVLAPHQFEPWDSRKQELLDLDPTSSIYTGLGQVADAVWGGTVPDPTGGATLFYAPKAQAAKGRAVPTWATGNGLDIGAHRFYQGNFPTPQGVEPSVAGVSTVQPILAGLGETPGRTASPKLPTRGGIKTPTPLFSQPETPLDTTNELFIKALIEAGVPIEQIQFFMGTR